MSGATTFSMVHTSGHTISATSDDHVRQSEFQFVCEACGSLTIKVAHPDRAPDTTIVECGRCNSPRGTLAALRHFARQGQRSVRVLAVSFTCLIEAPDQRRAGARQTRVSFQTPK